MYCEQQVGGNCRIHALNSYFQRPHITTDLFNEYKNNFKQLTRILHNYDCDEDLDNVNCDYGNIVCYILKNEHPSMATDIFGLNQHMYVDLRPYIAHSEFIFMYTADHIWGVKKCGQCWWRLDSLRPVVKTTINEILATKNVGIIVVTPANIVYAREVAAIKKNIKAVGRAVDYIIKCHKNGDVLGDVEVSIAKCIDILSRHTRSNTRIDKLCKKYYEFLSIFTKNNYNNLEMKLKHIPPIIYEISFLFDIYASV